MNYDEMGEELLRYERVIATLPQSVQDDITDRMAEATEADANNAEYRAGGGRMDLSVDQCREIDGLKPVGTVDIRSMPVEGVDDEN
jgi:hypothetical protein